MLHFVEPESLGIITNKSDRELLAKSHNEIVDALQQRSGEWALIAKYDGRRAGAARTFVSQINGYAPYRDATGDFEAVSRSEDGVTNVYARHVMIGE
jgi:hypothetical protein